jgi:hypothetical protein
MGFGVRSDGTDGEPCQSIKGRLRVVRDSRIVGMLGAMVAAAALAWVVGLGGIQAAGLAIGVGN